MIRTLLLAAIGTVLLPGSALAQSLAPIEKVLRFQVIDPSETAFPDVNSMVIGPDGTFYLGLYHLRSIRMYEPDGTFIDAFGSPGSADGQMGGISGMRWDGDTLVVLDRGFGRLVHFDRYGTPLGSEEAEFEPRFEVERTPAESFVIERGDRTLGWRSPYHFNPVAAESPDGNRAALVEMDHDRFTLTVVEGDSTVTHTHDWTPVPVHHDEIVTAIVRGFAATFEVEPETLHDEVEAAVVLPDYAPPVQGIALGENSVWLRMWRTPGTPARWTEFVDGTPVRTVELPHQAELLAIEGDRFFLTEQGEALYLVEYRITGPSALRPSSRPHPPASTKSRAAPSGSPGSSRGSPRS